MNKLNIHTSFKTFSIPVPGRWDELAPAQAANIAALVFGGRSRNETLAEIIYELADLRNRFWMRMLFFFFISEEELDEMRPLADFCHAQPENFVKQLFPVIGTGKSKLKGPKNGCSDLEFAEFIKAETALAKITAGGGMPEMDRLVAILYRKQKDDYRRENYDDADFERRLAVAAGQSPGLKICIYMWYAACREKIAASFPDIFIKKTEGATGEKGNWADVLMELAGGAANVEKVAWANATTVLYDFKMRLAKQKRQQKEIDKQRRS